VLYSLSTTLRVSGIILFVLGSIVLITNFVGSRKIRVKHQHQE
jgi:hypothetical protein